jgi:hypothetical protein
MMVDMLWLVRVEFSGGPVRSSAWQRSEQAEWFRQESAPKVCRTCPLRLEQHQAGGAESPWQALLRKSPWRLLVLPRPVQLP